MKTYLVISDLHCPFQHPAAFDFLNNLKKYYKPDIVVCIGDEIDAYAFSRFDKDPEMSSPADELARAVASLKTLYKIFPKVYVCESNHTLRPWKKAKAAGIPERMVKSYRDVLQAPDDWVWAHAHAFDNDVWRAITAGYNEKFSSDAIVFMHGDGYSGKGAATDAAEKNRANTVMGHTHSYPGLSYCGNQFGAIWGLNVGCLIDVQSPAFSYAKRNKNFPVIGTGVLIEGKPVFVPLEKQNLNPSA